MKRIAVIVIAVVFILFLIQNAEVVKVNFLFWSAQAPRVIVLGITFLLGLVAGLLAALPRKGREPAAGK